MYIFLLEYFSRIYLKCGKKKEEKRNLKRTILFT